jgi:hypothetical protein
MASLYDDIINYIKEYFPAYSEYGQSPETYRVMDKFYAPDVCFDDGMVTSREQWYKMCLSHPAVQDKITLEHLFVDEKQIEVGALLKTQAIERKTGKVLLELKMNVLYVLKIDDNKDFKIAKVKVFCESDAEKIAGLFQVYKTGP